MPRLILPPQTVLFLLLSCISLTAFADSPASAPYGGLRVGLQSYTLRQMDVAKACQQSQRLGLQYIEVYPRHLPLTTVPATIAEYRELLAANGLTLTGYGVVPLDANETKTREVFDFAKAVGLMSIVANPKKNRETFDLLDKLVAEYQIPVAIHNHGPGSDYPTVEVVLEWIDGRHELIGACVDTGHYLRSNQDPVDVIHKLKGRVYDVHLKDVRSVLSEEEKEKLYPTLPPRRADELRNNGKLFTILGEGELNIGGVIRALREIQYDRGVSLEYEENPQNPLSDVELSLSNLREAVASLDDPETGFLPLWDGKTLSGWKISENPDSWKIVDGEIIANGPRSHLFYVGPEAPFTNFELKVDVKAGPHSNGGIYFGTAFQQSGWPEQGFEAQVNNTYEKDPRKTGSLYQVQDVHTRIVPDDTWWTEHVIVQGHHVVIRIDGKTVVDYVQPEDYVPPDRYKGRTIQPGTVALQAHDPGSVVHYRNIRIKKLPD